MDPSIEVSVAELDRQQFDLLPRRETLTLVSVANVTAVNLALAVNAGSIGTAAVAVAAQQIKVGQM